MERSPFLDKLINEGELHVKNGGTWGDFFMAIAELMAVNVVRPLVEECENRSTNKEAYEKISAFYNSQYGLAIEMYEAGIKARIEKGEIKAIAVGDMDLN